MGGTQGKSKKDTCPHKGPIVDLMRQKSIFSVCPSGQNVLGFLQMVHWVE